MSSSAPAYSPAVGVEEEVAAALDDARVDREPDAVRRLEPEPERSTGPRLPSRAGGNVSVAAQADVLDDGLQRAELALDRRAER